MKIVLVVLALVVVVGIIVHMWAMRTFDRKVRADMQRVLSGAGPSSQRRVNIEALPEVVHVFARRSGASPAQAPHGVTYRQAVAFRMAPDKPWGPLTAEQVIAVREPGFLWYAEQRKGPVLSMRIVDAYVAGAGFLTVRLLGSIPVADFNGPEAAHSELMRYLAELPWAPDAMLHNPELRWKDVGNNVVEVEADSTGGVARMRLYFNEEGDIVEVQADARGATEGGKVVPRPWRGLFSTYQDIGGRRIPRHGEVGYIYEDGYAAYFRGEIIEYTTK